MASDGGGAEKLNGASGAENLRERSGIARVKIKIDKTLAASVALHVLVLG